MKATIGYAPDGTCVDFAKIVAITPVRRASGFFELRYCFDVYFLASETPFAQKAPGALSITITSDRYHVTQWPSIAGKRLPDEAASDERAMAKEMNEIFQKELIDAKNDWSEKRDHFISQWENFKAE